MIIIYEVTAALTEDGFLGTMITDDPDTDDLKTYPVGGATMVTVGTGGTGEVDEDDLATDSTTAGSNESLMLESMIGYHDNTDNIIVKLDKFGVPGSIDTSDVRISLTGGAADSGFPSDIEVDGTTVTLVGPVVDGQRRRCWF